MTANKTIIVDTDVRIFFQTLVDDAVTNQHIDASDETVIYLVNLLTTFTHTQALYEKTADGLQLKPLAMLYADAVAATSTEERNLALKRLGDVALFISGVFTDSLNRKMVDVDYYIAMGGNAYGYLSDTSHRTARWEVFRDVFNELANNFTAFVDVLGEVSERTNQKTDRDILRLYEVWMRTGSARAKSKLQQLGIVPSNAACSQLQH